jgi:subtilisin family serine protease
VKEALVVGATGRTDYRPAWSNYGGCIDLFAPGVGILSAWGSGNSATSTLSGTSMATPHVSGAAALYLAAHPSARPWQVQQALRSAATQGKVRGIGADSPNRLLRVV